MPDWQPQELPAATEVAAVAEAADGTLWACGRRRGASGDSTGLVLRRQAAGWQIAGEFPGHPLRHLYVGAHGDVCAVGERALVRRIGSRWDVQPLSEPGQYTVWGHAPDDVYVLRSDALWHHDGAQLRRVDLAAQDVSGRWAQGDGSPDGDNWLVGTYGTHSCLATGSGLRWRQDGCSSWYLYRVKVAGQGRAWIAGGDGFFTLRDGEWVREGRYEPKASYLPLAIHVFGGRVFHVSTPFHEYLESGGAMHSVTVCGDSGRFPCPLPQQNNVAVCLLRSGRLLCVSDSGALWESAPLGL